MKTDSRKIYEKLKNKGEAKSMKYLLFLLRRFMNEVFFFFYTFII